MAKLNTSGLDSVMAEMTRIGEECGPTAEKMIMAGAALVKDAWKETADKHGHRRTGDMIDSIGYARKPKRVGDTLSIDVYPQGKDRKGTRNAEKAFVLHYGTSKIKGSGWVDEAEEKGEETAIPEMIRIWNDAK